MGHDTRQASRTERAALALSTGDTATAQRERELALLEEAAQLLGSARSLRDIYPVIVRAAALIVATTGRRWRASFLALEGDRLRRVAMHDEAGIEVATQEYALADYPALSRVVETGELAFGDATALSTGIPTEVAATVSRARLAVAVMLRVEHAGETFGVLGLSSRDPGPVEEVPVQRLGAIAHLAALAIANARYVAEQRGVAEQARSLEQAKTRFLNLAAHELRGPITVLRGYLSMMAEGALEPLSPGLQDIVSMLLAKTDAMNRLVGDMLETARLEEGRLDLERHDADLRDIAAEAVAIMAPLVGENRVTMIACPDPLPVRGDASRLATVITNLLDNAGKYSDPVSPIEVECSGAGNLAVVSVTDHGIGLSEDDQAVLFTRFGRITSPLTSHIPGTGLGLWLCREIARLHGGDIDVQSRQGQGSRFSLVLPMAPSDR